MSIEQLVRMANDIGQFFAAESVHSEAVAGIASHIKRSWDPRMRRQILTHLQQGGEGLDAVVREALAALEPPPPAS